MEKEIGKGSSKKLLIMLIMFVIFQIASLVFYGLDYGFDLPWTVECVILFTAGILMYSSYRNHTKNVMKPVIGATLAIIMYYNMEIAMDYLQSIIVIFDNLNGNIADIVYTVSQIAVFVVLALMNIMHYVINSTHHSSPGKIKFNKFLYVLFVIFSIANCVAFLFTTYGVNLKVSCFVGNMADFFLVSMVVSIEGFLDEFRIEREAKAEQA